MKETDYLFRLIIWCNLKYGFYWCPLYLICYDSYLWDATILSSQLGLRYSVPLLIFPRSWIIARKVHGLLKVPKGICHPNPCDSFSFTSTYFVWKSRQEKLTNKFKFGCGLVPPNTRVYDTIGIDYQSMNLSIGLFWFLSQLKWVVSGQLWSTLVNYQGCQIERMVSKSQPNTTIKSAYH